jgi:hypothetical protein
LTHIDARAKYSGYSICTGGKCNWCLQVSTLQIQSGSKWFKVVQGESRMVPVQSGWIKADWPGGSSSSFSGCAEVAVSRPLLCTWSGSYAWCVALECSRSDGFQFQF